MSLPIKTRLLNAIGDVINNISEIKKVIENKSKPIDKDTVPYPLAYIFDDIETREKINEEGFGTFPLHIEVWIKSLTFSADANVIQAEIHKDIHTDSTVNSLCTNIKELTVEKLYVDEDMGVLILEYEIKYVHDWADPYGMRT